MFPARPGTTNSGGVKDYIVLGREHVEIYSYTLQCAAHIPNFTAILAIWIHN